MRFGRGLRVWMWSNGGRFRVGVWFKGGRFGGGFRRFYCRWFWWFGCWWFRRFDGMFRRFVGSRRWFRRATFASE
ncbi:unnamed protein product [Brassica rapa subsp. trilocularis]